MSSVLLFLAISSLISGLLAQDVYSGAVFLVLGMSKSHNLISYGILRNTQTLRETIVHHGDLVSAGLGTGDYAELELYDDATEQSQGPPGVNPRRISRVRHHSKSQVTKAASVGQRSLLAIRINYLDSAENQCSENCVMSNLYTSSRSVQAMYSEDSYGTLTFDTSTSITKPRVITVSIGRSIGDPCANSQSLNQISSEADAAVVAAGVALSNYDVKIYFTTAICGIGVSFVGEVRSFINSGSSDTLAHELGHTFGAGHASLDPANFPTNFQVTFGQSTANILEYGDASCVMGIGGFGLRGMNGPHRNSFGWIPSGAILTPSLTACPITVTLRTLFLTPDSTGVSLVRIPKSSGGNYFISFRTPEGQDSNMPYANMVGIHSHTGGSANTFLWKYAVAGETVATSDGVVVSVLSVQGSTAVVTLAQNGVGVSCTTQSPSPSLASPSQSKSFTPSSSPTPTNRPTIQCGQTVQSSNVGRSNEFNVRGGDGPDVAFAFTLNATTTVTFSTCNQANFDTLIQVFGSDGVTSFGFNDDDSRCGLTSSLTVTLATGSYLVVVDGYNGATGSFSLSVSCGVTGTASVAASPIPESTSRTASVAASASRTSLPSRSSSPSATMSPGTLSETPSPSVTPTSQGTIHCGQTVQGSSVGTQNGFDVSGPDGSDVAYIFVADVPTVVTFSTCNRTCNQANFDTLLQVFGSDRVTSFGFNDDERCGLASVLTVTLPVGSYFVVVDGYNGITGTFSLSAVCFTASQTPTPSFTPTTTPVLSSSPSPTAPNRLTISCGTSVQGSNVGAANSYRLVTGDGADIAYSFTLTSTTTVRFSTCNQANFDTLLGLFSGSTRLAVVDDSPGCRVTSVLGAVLRAGQYVVVVDGYNGATGSFTLTMTCSR